MSHPNNYDHAGRFDALERHVPVNQLQVAAQIRDELDQLISEAVSAKLPYLKQKLTAAFMQAVEDAKEED